MVPTVTLKKHRTDKRNKKGLCPIYIESYYRGQRVNKSTKIFVEDNHWQVDKISEDHPFHKKLNRDLRQQVADMEKHYSAQAETGDVQLKRVIKDSQLSFVDYARKIIERQNKKLGEKTIEKYQVKLSIIERFDKHTRIGRINYAWLEQLEEWLRRDKGGNTVWDYFKLIRKVCPNAHRKGILNPYPFEAYPFPEYRDPEITYLVKDDLEKIKTFINSAPAVDDSLIIALFFLLECYSGLRHSDWSRFKTEKLIDGEALKVNTKKNGEPVYLYLEDSPPLKWVVDTIRRQRIKYKFTLDKANTELKHLAKLWNIDKRLSTHTARHSFGVMCAELGISKETAADCLGITTKVCEVYYKVTRQKVRSEFKAWQNF